MEAIGLCGVLWPLTGVQAQFEHASFDACHVRLEPPEHSCEGRLSDGVVYSFFPLNFPPLWITPNIEDGKTLQRSRSQDFKWDLSALDLRFEYR
jgi:hypothetical protein